MPRRNVVYTLIVALISLFIVSRTSFKEQIVRNVARLIAQNSIEAPSETTLMEGAFTGMANAVGDAPYTAYLPPQDQEDYLREMNGQYAGIAHARRRCHTLGILVPLDILPSVQDVHRSDT